MTDLALPWLPETMSRFDRIVIDDLEQEAKMSKPMIKPELVAGDLTGLVCGDFAGTAKRKRQDDLRVPRDGRRRSRGRWTGICPREGDRRA